MNDYAVHLNGKKFDVLISAGNEILIKDRKIKFDLVEKSPHSFLLKLNEKMYHLIADKKNHNSYVVMLGGYNFEITIRTFLQEKAIKLIEEARSSEHRLTEIKAPMPGLILKVKRKPGDEIKQGESVLILEAMKMENDLKAPSSGILKSINVSEGSAVEKGVLLYSIE